ncbi:origin recognition complex subunit 2 [Crotalus tigris]|uniref:origin recognition complex subunit 2 n=1 Tax=Crotalus tigris TaxID=88082 RepID=UPI00192FA3F4|nr:origin recognition complex subunit 2 [Crotalus tigris]XP_039209720.1 origin recognition complex subunit 2 [Crotalus tigris]XP_039209728.1 origin recognition complex subunit 2 [Crotalus tigris]XP_039209738.1 origin recognition complex subunit 2 [Crotalus tigris]XP_039209747.1 origin recognition complex subunit 2 [Crotalus tigris]XP_039209756.1 origin recognition complex subunit 2 [Crotalus tigris]XP_039209765.1 origin recognition complex subunit 2 [Crotalus tigris]XP_039209774.1 origin rec
MSNRKIKGINALNVRFVADEDVLKHISEDAGLKVRKLSVPHTLDIKKWMKNLETSSDEETQDIFKEQDYVTALDVQESMRNGSSASGGDVFPFQTPKHSNKMAEKVSELIQNSAKNAKQNNLKKCEEKTNTPEMSSKCSSSKDQEDTKRNDLLSKLSYRTRKRMTALNMCSDSESDYSASTSEEGDDACSVSAVLPKIPIRSQTSSVPSNKETSAKKLKRYISSNLVEEYFEAHSSSKVLTSDRTLQKLEKKKLDQESLQNLLNDVPVAFAAERDKLMTQHESLFYKWMLQLHLGFNIVLYGLGSKRDLLEKFRISLLQDSVHLVINGFFPNITIKSILNSITEEVLNHMGTFRSPQDQVDFILKSFKEDVSSELYLLIHNLDSKMLRGDKSQQILGQLSSLSNVYLIASIDHINAPLMWDQAKQSMYNWLWYETTTFSPYAEETAYENSLLVQHSGSLALSSLTHVLCSLTSNARGIFRLLVEYQLENKDNPSYLGLSFQDLYQRCREAFLVNSDLTLRAQLIEFRDHKLIRTKRGADGVEYLLIPVDAGILADFLQKDNDV